MLTPEDRIRRERENARVAQAITEAGVPVTSVFDLIYSHDSYSEAFPILVRLLEEGVTDDWILIGVVKALTEKAAYELAWDQLVDLYRDPNIDLFVKWYVGCALATMARKDDLDLLLSFVQDEQYGTARQELVAGLARWAHPDITTLLIDLLDDDDVMLQAIEALAAGSPPPPMRLEELADDPRPHIRKYAKKALVRIKAKETRESGTTRG